MRDFVVKPLAIYHLHASTGSRQGGQSASAKADYIQRQGKYDRGDDEVAHTESGHLPKWAAAEPNDYWQAADAGERANGRLFREVEFALPVELDEGQRVELAREFAQQVTKDEQLPYTLAIHRGESRVPGKPDNPHCHLLISERANDGIARSAATWFKRYNAKDPEKGGARKSTATKPKELLENTREAWGERANEALERAGHNGRIHEGTLEQQYWDAVEEGNEQEAARLQDREPGVHLGPALHMEERGIKTDRGSLHAEIAECNAIAAQIAACRNEERDLQHEMDRTRAIAAPALPALEDSKVRGGPVKPKMEEEAERQKQRPDHDLMSR